MRSRLSAITILGGLALSSLACSPGTDRLAATLPTDRSPGVIRAADLPATWTPTTIPTTPPETATHPSPTGDPAGEQSTNHPRPPIPTAQIVTPVRVGSNTSGWQRVETNLAVFELPDRFEVLDLGSGFSEFFGAFAGGLIEGMSEFAQEFTGAPGVTPTPIGAAGLGEDLAFDFVLAVEPDQLISIVLFSQPLEGDPSLATLMEEALEGFEDPFEISAWQVVTGSPIPTGRIELLFDDREGLSTRQALIYVFQHGSRSWSLMFQTTAVVFATKLGEFEAIAASFEPE